MSLVTIARTVHENYMKWLVSGLPETHDPEMLCLTHSPSEKRHSDFVLVAAMKGHVPVLGKVTSGTHELYVGEGMLSPLEKAEDVEYQLSLDGRMVNVNFRLNGMDGLIYVPANTKCSSYGHIKVGAGISSLFPVNFVRGKR